MSKAAARPGLQAVPDPQPDVEAAGGAEQEVVGQSGGEPGGTPGLIPPKRKGDRSRFIADVLVELEFVTRERADAAVEEARNSGKKTGQVLLDSGTVTADQLAQALAERFSLDYIDLNIYQADMSALNLISPASARRFNAVPVGYEKEGGKGRLLVAIADPTNVLALDDLKLMTGHELRPVVAAADDIGALISKMNRLDGAIQEAIDEEVDDEEVSEVRESADDAPVIKLVNSIIAQGVESGASDIHFEPAGKDMRVRFRIDGVLVETTTIPRKMVAGVISRVKIMGDLDIAEKRVPQDGRVGMKVEGHGVDLRIVSMPSMHGEGIVMRILDKSKVMLTLDTLGIRDEPRRRFEEGFRQSYGAVLVTGPTGSGKSTTLYAALNEVKSPEKNVITIEDPVEYQMPGITQLQVNQKAGLTFARGLRSMLRADPDIIMVGEIRDAETARIAIESALTGHLVLSTLHTNDAPSALSRLTEMGIEPFLTASAVRCVVAQRLLRVLCKHCKKRTILTVQALAAAGFKADFDMEAYDPVGCTRCRHTGYKGRVGLYEVMVTSDEIRQLTVERQSADAIARVAMGEGMRRLREDGLEKVARGITSITEVARVT